MLEYLVLFLIIIISIIFLMRNFDYSNPPKMFLAYWVLNIVAGIIVFNRSVDWKFIGIMYLLLSVLCFYISAIIMEKIVDVGQCKYTDWHLHKSSIEIVLIICFFCGILYNSLELSNNGFSLLRLFREDELARAAYYFTDGRYGTKTVIITTLVEQVCLTISYAGILFAGYMQKVGNVKKMLLYIQFIPMILCMLYSTAKTPFICSVLLWISGLMLANNTYASLIKRKKLNIKKIVAICFVAYALLFFSFYLRYDGGSLEYIFDRIIVYAIGHIPTYDEWFSHFKGNSFGYSYGYETFMGIIGGEMPSRLRDVYYSIVYETKYSSTTVITLFACTIMDFGYIGSLIFWTILGSISGILYKVIRATESPLCMGLLGLIYFELLYSFLLSALRYKSLIGAYILFPIFLWSVKYIKVNERLLKYEDKS